MAPCLRVCCLLRRETYLARLERRDREPEPRRLADGTTRAGGHGPRPAWCVSSRISTVAASTLCPRCLQVSVRGQSSKQTSFPTVSPVRGQSSKQTSFPAVSPVTGSRRGIICTERLHPCRPRRGRAQVRDVRAQGHLRRRRGGPSLHARVLRCRCRGPPGRRRSGPAFVNPV